MKVEEFIDLVAEMRAAQRMYFAERTKENLIAAKALERRVDKTLLDQTIQPAKTSMVP